MLSPYCNSVCPKCFARPVLHKRLLIHFIKKLIFTVPMPVPMLECLLGGTTVWRKTSFKKSTRNQEVKKTMV